MPYQNTAFPVLSTGCSPWNNGLLLGQHKRMVDRGKPGTTVEQRLDEVRRATGCAKKAAFAKWITAESPQAVQAWAARNKITADGAVLINRFTGADTHWLLTGEGVAFPRGATPYPGAAVAGDGRLSALEAHVDVLSGALARVVSVLSAKLPGVASEIAAALREQAEAGRPLPPELAVVVAAAEAAGRSAAPATRRAAPVGSVGKPPRRGK